MQYINISDIKPASYNPRKISQQQFNKLQESIKNIGFVMPILVNKSNMTIIAGHQRTKAAKAIGVEQVPVFFCNNINQADEIKFNQIHNGTDNELGAVAYYGDLPGEGFYEFNADDFVVKNKNASIVKEICKLILNYGNVLCCIIDKKGSLVGANYVWACKLLKVKVNTSVIENSRYREYLKDDYGVFCYDKLSKNTWVQGLAQLQRDASKKETGKKKQKSALYENCVLPNLNVQDSVLDFGCGKGAYINSLKNKATIGVEFYNNNRSAINITKGNNQIDRLVEHLKSDKKFDVVVCDSVLNSVDSLKAEKSVVACLNLFCKDNGKLFISGRPIEGFENKLTRKTDKNVGKRFIEFVDADKFTGNFRKGNWYYQHFHSKDDAIQLIERSGFRIDKIYWQKFGDSWQVEATKINNLDEKEYRNAVDFEFDLPLPKNKSYKRNQEIKQICGVD